MDNEEKCIIINNNLPILINCIPNKSIMQLDEADQRNEVENKESFDK